MQLFVWSAKWAGAHGLNLGRAPQPGAPEFHADAELCMTGGGKGADALHANAELGGQVVYSAQIR